jgi:hypothetical protein
MRTIRMASVYKDACRHVVVAWASRRNFHRISNEQDIRTAFPKYGRGRE